MALMKNGEMLACNSDQGRGTDLLGL